MKVLLRQIHGSSEIFKSAKKIAGHAMYESCKICTPYVCQGMPGHVRSKMGSLIEDKTRSWGGRWCLLCREARE